MIGVFKWDTLRFRVTGHGQERRIDALIEMNWDFLNVFSFMYCVSAQQLACGHWTMAKTSRVNRPNVFCLILPKSTCCEMMLLLFRLKLNLEPVLNTFWYIILMVTVWYVFMNVISHFWVHNPAVLILSGQTTDPKIGTGTGTSYWIIRVFLDWKYLEMKKDPSRIKARKSASFFNKLSMKY